MARYKITVLRKMFNADFAKDYCQGNPTVCPRFQEGQEFLTDFDRPEGFCEWAWDDIYKYMLVFRSGGNLTDKIQWMKDRNTIIACCSDGIRPVVFKIERIE